MNKNIGRCSEARGVGKDFRSTSQPADEQKINMCQGVLVIGKESCRITDYLMNKNSLMEIAIDKAFFEHCQ